MKGDIQLFNSKSSESKVVEGFACTFVKFHSQKLDTEILLFARCTSSHIEIIDVENTSNYSHKVPFSLEKGEFAIAVIASKDTRSLFIPLKFGHLFLCDLESGRVSFGARISTAIVIRACAHSEGGIVSMDKSGAVVWSYKD